MAEEVEEPKPPKAEDPESESDCDYEACPDIEVIIRLCQNEKFLQSIPANINMSKTVLQLKQALATHLNVPAEQLQMQRNGTTLEDSKKIVYYEVEADDTLHVHITDR